MPRESRTVETTATADDRRTQLWLRRSTALALTLTVLQIPTSAAWASETVPGEVSILIVDDHSREAGPHAGIAAAAEATGEPQTQTVVATARGTFSVPDELAGALTTGDDVQVTLLQDPTSPTGAEVIDLTPDPSTPTRRLAAALRPAASQSLIVLPVYWTAPDSQTSTSLTALAQNVSNYWKRQSGNTLSVSVASRGWKQIAAPAPNTCDPAFFWDAALAAHAMTQPSSTQHYAIYFPATEACEWDGLATITGSMILVNGAAETDVMAHEFGHNLGLGHANAYVCPKAGPQVSLLADTTQCAVSEYLDVADVMGYATTMSTGNLNSAFADHLGWLTSVTPEPGAGLSVDLAPLSEVTALRAVKLDAGAGWIYVDYRPNIAPDTRVPAWAGLQVHYVPKGGSFPESHLLDLKPWLQGTFTDVDLPLYATWAVPGTDLALTLKALGATAQVRLVRTGSDITPPPTPTASATRTSTTQATLRWNSVVDSGSGVSGFRALVNGIPAAFASPTSTSISVPVAQGDELRLEVYDAAGNTTRTAVIPVSAMPTDGTAPSLPTITKPAAASATKNTSIVFSWKPALDPESGITSYRVSRKTGTITTSTTVSAATTNVVLSIPANKSSVLSVAAVNGRGLTGPAASVTVRHDTIAPTAPTGLGRVPGTGLATWKASTDAGPVRYQVYLDGVLWERTSALRTSRIAPSGKHTWSVRAIDAVGIASAYARATAMVDTSAPSTPASRITSVVLRSDGTRAVTLTWTAAADSQSGIAAYRVETATSTGTVVKTLGSSYRQATVSVPRTGATIRVRAINGGGTRGSANNLSVAAR